MASAAHHRRYISKGEDMKKGVSIIIGSLILLFAYAAALQAEQEIGERISLKEAIQTAAEENPEVKAARFQVEASGFDLTGAKSALLPRVDLSETFSRTNNPMWAFGTKLNQGVITQPDFNPADLNDPDAVNNFTTSLSLSWSVYDGGQTDLGIKQSENKIVIASLMLKRKRQEVIARTATTYAALLLARKSLAVLDQALETARANLKIVQSRFDSGFVVKSDLLRAKVRIGDLQQRRLMAESGIEIAGAKLSALMGKPLMTAGTPFIPSTPLSDLRETGGTLKEWMKKAHKNRPELQIMSSRRAVAEAEIGKARAGHRPGLKLIGTYELDSEDLSDMADSYNVGAVLSINLYSGNRISSRAKAALSALSEIKEQIKGLEVGIALETKEYYLQAKSARKRIEVAGSAAVQAEESLRITKNRYESGLITIVGLLDAEEARQQSRMNLYKALHDYQAARVRLALAAGTIDVDFE